MLSGVQKGEFENMRISGPQNKVLLLGGVSAVGKSTALQILESQHGIAPCWFHKQMIAEAAMHGVDRSRLAEHWSRFVPGASRRYVDELRSKRQLATDIHFAIQPTRDTLLALGQDSSAYFDEPYRLAIEPEWIDLLQEQRTRIVCAVLEASTDAIIGRRLGRNTAIRSLDPRDIDTERDMELALCMDFASRRGLQTAVINNSNASGNETARNLAALLEDYHEGDNIYKIIA
jgi:adenylate kinase